MSETQQPKNKFWMEFGPVLAFFVAYMWLQRQGNDQALYIAAIILAVLSIVALLWGWIKYKHISGIVIFSTVIICGSAALGYYFQDDRFITMKPTVINILFGAAFIGGVIFKKNVIKLMFGDAFELPDNKWNVLAIRWGLFFFALALLNELVWRNTSREFWVSFKAFGLIPLTIIFTMTQIPFILKNGTVKGQEAVGNNQSE